MWVEQEMQMFDADIKVVNKILNLVLSDGKEVQEVSLDSKIIAVPTLQFQLCHSLKALDGRFQKYTICEL